MSLHIIIIVFLLLLLFNNNITEGFLVLTDIPSSKREELDAAQKRFKTEIEEIIGDTNGNVDDHIRKEIIKMNLKVNSLNEEEQDIDLLTEVLNEMENEVLNGISDPEQREIARERLDNKKQAEIERYGSRIQFLSKGDLNEKYIDLEEKYNFEPLCVAKNKEDNAYCRQYDKNEQTCISEEKCIYFQDSNSSTILSNLNEFYQQSQDLELLLQESGQEQCSIEKAEMNEDFLKQLSKEISQKSAIQRRVTMLEKQLDDMKKKKKGKKCNGKKKVRPNCNVGMYKIPKHKQKKECHSRYGTYRGQDIQCQYVKKGWRYSCDFWKPGKPYTKKLC